MTLTPQDVERQTFSTALRGYDLNEVDDFLDQVVVTLRELNSKIGPGGEAPPTDGVATLDPVVEPPVSEPAAVTAPVVDESAVGRVLITAQETADQIVANARSESDRILAEARSEADELMTRRDEHRAEAETEMAALASRVAEVRNKLAVLATEVSHKLDEMDVSIESAVATDGSDQEADEPGDDADANDDGSSQSDDDAGEFVLGYRDDADPGVSDEGHHGTDDSDDDDDDDSDVSDEDHDLPESVADAIASLGGTDEDADEE